MGSHAVLVSRKEHPGCPHRFAVCSSNGSGWHRFDDSLFSEWVDWAILHVKVAYTPLGIILALIFIGIPFVIRTVQPVIEGLEQEVEEAAAILGATRKQTFFMYCCLPCFQR